MELLTKLEMILPALLVINIVLSAISKAMAVLGKQEIPVLSQAAVILQKVIDFLSANNKH